MANNYTDLTIKVSDLLLDEENPRFASSRLEKNNNYSIEQSTIILHLLKYANILDIAERINDVGDLHGAERIVCFKKDNNYIVLEGNRRVCACKLLLDRNLIPNEYKSSFPIISEITKENLKNIKIVVYNSRENVQKFLSDRHIAGVKKWSALEKNNYYMKLFREHKSIKKIEEITSDNTAIIKKSIIKYQFFMDVFDIISVKNKTLKIENLDYLPMVDRFMDLIVSDDPDVGLSLTFNEASLKYSTSEHKKTIYKEILLKIGEAFLLRKDQKNCLENELSKIISTEIMNKNKQKDLILADERIPGLLSLIKKYKNSTDVNIKEPTFSPTEAPKSINTNINSNIDVIKNDNNDEKPFTPSKPHSPKKTLQEYLNFLEDETKNWNIRGKSDYEVKINAIIYELSKLKIREYPYACIMLLRSLLEICTKFVYYENPKIKEELYNANNLEQNMIYLNDNFFFKNSSKENDKLKKNIATTLKNNKIIDIINLYVHHSKPVNEDIVLSNWNTMKYYIIACLKYEKNKT